MGNIFEDRETDVNMCAALEHQQAMEAVGIPKDQQQTYLQKL